MISGIPVGEDLDKLKKLITGDTTGIQDCRLILDMGKARLRGFSQH